MLFSEDTARTGYVELPVIRHYGNAQTPEADEVAEEFPVALVYNGISHAVMMTTPRDLEEFAVGFSLTEGIVASAADIHDLDVVMHRTSAEVRLSIAQPEFLKLKGKRRALAGRTGCGVCGIESIELLDLVPEKIVPSPSLFHVGAAVIERVTQELPSHQVLMKSTGGVHAAAWCDKEGTILKVFEDVGRHNGLDKLIGYLAMQDIDMRQGFVFLSSRASYELVRKAARMNIPMLATISAPTSLAIEIAQQAGMRLMSFCRRDTFVQYTSQAEPGSPGVACSHRGKDSCALPNVEAVRTGGQ
ncbi:formate dehydrogenase accessory sulfurtransferase FdhD [Undibacterium sp. Jales W-56]|uniref:formate dehydrogenase accessory sulfurtransferase FdhD n=1 Tax=Undibacterium sp. Jales W-56 TaxID=2897325 RepID=UPI0021D209F7|nr:formate dehydrogenase accessory sulfurtransferase FdhD [Undibacterium sp. Jales W-56]MCU6433356.1 formate dehydrogenase accessory sulfurtransferase FdhD [Undibacterium sp. Jales W-56]